MTEIRDSLSDPIKEPSEEDKRKAGLRAVANSTSREELRMFLMQMGLKEDPQAKTWIRSGNVTKTKSKSRNKRRTRTAQLRAEDEAYFNSGESA